MENIYSLFLITDEYIIDKNNKKKKQIQKTVLSINLD